MAIFEVTETLKLYRMRTWDVEADTEEEAIDLVNRNVDGEYDETTCTKEWEDWDESWVEVHE